MTICVVPPQGTGYGGVIHTVRDGKKQTELPIDRITWQNPELEMFMEKTGVVYRGKVDFGKDIIDGRLFYGEERGPKMDLRRTSPKQVAGLQACPKAYTYEPPTAVDDGLVTGDIQDVGLTRDAATDLVNAICAGDAGVIHSLLVLAEGKVVVEEYFHGYGRDDLHRLASVTKSISSLLVGLAIDREEISGIDAPVVDFFPESLENVGHRWQQETLRHLLTMSMGLDWGVGEGPHGTGPEFFQEVFGREVIHEPGSQFIGWWPARDLVFVVTGGGMTTTTSTSRLRRSSLGIWGSDSVIRILERPELWHSLDGECSGI